MRVYLRSVRAVLLCRGTEVGQRSTFSASSSSLSPASNQSEFTRMSTFDIPGKYSELLGHRSLIITLGDEDSQQVSQHLWMRFQMAGKLYFRQCFALVEPSK